MNELMLQLAKQAGLKFPSETALSPAEERFAELIVKECADTCEQIAKANLEAENPIAYVYGARQCRDVIKNFFGVE